jgi:hypothetical protein
MHFSASGLSSSFYVCYLPTSQKYLGREEMKERRRTKGTLKMDKTPRLGADSLDCMRGTMLLGKE